MTYARLTISYLSKITAGLLVRNEGQLNAAMLLDKVLQRVVQYGCQRHAASILFRYFSGSADSQHAMEVKSALQLPMHVDSLGYFIAKIPRGVYLHGSVGCGKTMLLDSCWQILASETYTESQVKGSLSDMLPRLQALRSQYEQAVHEGTKRSHSPRPFWMERNLPSDASLLLSDISWPLPLPCRRVHFNAFLTELHSRVHTWKLQHSSMRRKKANGATERNAIVEVSREIAEEAWVLCLDEVQVTDVADAMILSQVFATLLSHGVVLLSTSNWHPQHLYRDGLNRDNFLPTIDMLQRMNKIMEIPCSIDFRVANTTTTCRNVMQRVVSETEQDMHMGVVQIPTPFGRQVTVHGKPHNFAVLDFQELRDSRWGAADLHTIARMFPRVTLRGVPMLHTVSADVARRFFILVDELYEAKCRLSLQSCVSLADMFQGVIVDDSTPDTVEPASVDAAASTPDVALADTSVSFNKDVNLTMIARRTRSRLVQMCGDDFHRHVRAAA